MMSTVEHTAEKDAPAVAAALRAHRMLARNAAGRMGCRGCRWETERTPGTDAAWAEYADHVADAMRVTPPGDARP